MSSDVVGGIDKNETGEVTHGIHKIGIAAIIGDLAGSPEIDMKDIKRTAERPREDQFAVACDRAIGSDAMRALENPIGNVFTAERPEKTQANAMKSLVNAHVTSGRGSMVSRKNVSAER
jgi:hypothetical protein